MPGKPSAPRAILVEDEPLLRAELRAQLARLWPELAVVGEAADGIEALRLIAEHLPDVVFLDIQIPGVNGLEVAALASGRAHVVFVTAHEEHALAAFRHGAVDYVMKPLESERLRTTVSRLRTRIGEAPLDLTHVIEQLATGSNDERIRWIQASAGNRIRIVPVEEVIFFQSDAKYTKVVAERGEMHIRRTIKELAEQLDSDAFWQIGRGVIVNVARIEEVTRDGEQLEVRMRGRPERLAVSQPFHHLFRRM